MDDQVLLEAIGQMMDKKLDEKLTPIQKQVDVLTQDTAALRAYAATTKSDVQMLQRHVEDMREELDDMHKGIDAIVAWVDTIESKQSAM